MRESLQRGKGRQYHLSVKGFRGENVPKAVTPERKTFVSRSVVAKKNLERPCQGGRKKERRGDTRERQEEPSAIAGG